MYKINITKNVKCLYAMNEDHKHSDIAEVWDFLFDFFVCTVLVHK